MKKFKYILILLLLVTATVAINGGTKIKCKVEQVGATQPIKRTIAQGFPDLVTFANFLSQ